LSNKSPNYWAIVPAAGSGTRMGGDRPKQYLPLHDKPILQHTLERLHSAGVMGIVVCLAENDNNWSTLTLPPCLVIPATGGSERCYSVFNGLCALQPHAQPDDWVLVHDAARPCVRVADIAKLMKTLANHPVGGLLAVPVRDTMKRADNQGNILETVSRNGLWHALTPQMFRLQFLTEVLHNVIRRGELVTDEAQAMERFGYSPLLVEGHSDNIKITQPQDLLLAELFLANHAH